MRSFLLVDDTIVSLALLQGGAAPVYMYPCTHAQINTNMLCQPSLNRTVWQADMHRIWLACNRKPLENMQLGWGEENDPLLTYPHGPPTS